MTIIRIRKRRYIAIFFKNNKCGLFVISDVKFIYSLCENALIEINIKIKITEPCRIILLNMILYLINDFFSAK